MAVLFSPLLLELDPRLANAAASLGATPLATLRTVALPVLITAFASALVFAVLRAVDDISAGLFLSRSDRRRRATALAESKHDVAVANFEADVAGGELRIDITDTHSVAAAMPRSARSMR